MATKARSRPPRVDSLSRERIVEASIELLDQSGTDGLTFRALSERLATGPGAIYGHVANKDDLLIAACDTIVARTMEERVVGSTPKATLRNLAMGLFDAIDAHPWVGLALIHAPGELPTVRILERIGQQIRALGVPVDAQWAAASALLNYLLGAGGRTQSKGNPPGPEASTGAEFLASVSAVWSQLDPDDYPFARSGASRLQGRNNPLVFLAGIDFILSGITAGAR